MKYKTILGKTVKLTDERKKHIFHRHPDVAEHFHKVEQIFSSPDEIRIDNADKNVLLFYKYFSKIGKGKYLVVVIKINRRNFILTFFSAYRMKTGEKYEY